MSAPRRNIPQSSPSWDALARPCSGDPEGDAPRGPDAGGRDQPCDAGSRHTGYPTLREGDAPEAAAPSSCVPSRFQSSPPFAKEMRQAGGMVLGELLILAVVAWSGPLGLRGYPCPAGESGRRRIRPLPLAQFGITCVSTHGCTASLKTSGGFSAGSARPIGPGQRGALPLARVPGVQRRHWHMDPDLPYTISYMV